jgi:hypothetical protein
MVTNLPVAIGGELTRLGYATAPSAVWLLLTRTGMDLVPRYVGLTWRQLLSAQAEETLAVDFSHQVGRLPLPISPLG